MAFIGFLPIVFVYFLINHFPIFESRYLPFLFGEENIPYVDWTGLLYVSFFPFLLLMMYFAPKENFGRMYLIFYAMCAAHFLIFIFFPTIFPRHDNNNDWLFRIIKSVDAPNNCFPSMHVSVSVFWSLVILKRRNDWVGGLIFACVILIALSTLTTKQHYVIDVFGGLAMAGIAFLFVVINRTRS